MAAPLKRLNFMPKRHWQLNTRREQALKFLPFEVQQVVEARKSKNFKFWQAFDAATGWKQGWTKVALYQWYGGVFGGEWVVSEGGLNWRAKGATKVEDEVVLEEAQGWVGGRQQALTMAEAGLDWVDSKTAEVVFRARVQELEALTGVQD